MALTSYGLMYGTLSYPWDERPDPTYDPLGQINGCFNDLPRITLAAITDGLSYTAFASERALSYLNRDLTRPHGHWVASHSSSTLLYATLPPNRVFRVSLPKYALTLGSMVASFHGGGAHILLGDGSVRFVTETIDCWPINLEPLGPVGIGQVADGFINVPPPGIWQALATRAGGEVIGDY